EQIRPKRPSCRAGANFHEQSTLSAAGRPAAQIRARAPQSQQYFKSTHCAARLVARAARTQAVTSTNLRRDRAQHRSCATEGSRAGEKKPTQPAEKKE